MRGAVAGVHPVDNVIPARPAVLAEAGPAVLPPKWRVAARAGPGHGVALPVVIAWDFLRAAVRLRVHVQHQPVHGLARHDDRRKRVSRRRAVHDRGMLRRRQRKKQEESGGGGGGRRRTDVAY